jgi:hypothetical protein
VTASNASHSPDRHPSDGVLLALHDGESGGTLDADRVHVDHCADCQTRLAAIQNNSATVRQALAAIVVPPLDTDAVRRQLAATHATRVVPLWRWPATLAASVLIVATAMTAAAGPLRHWIAEHMSRSNGRATVVRPSSTSVESQRPVSGSTVSFAVVGSEFLVRLDSLPAAGELTIERVTTDKISARVSAGVGTGGDAMVVLPGELLLRNTASSRASYTLALPHEVVRLRVIVAGRAVFDGSPPKEVKLTR